MHWLSSLLPSVGHAVSFTFYPMRFLPVLILTILAATLRANTTTVVGSDLLSPVLDNGLAAYAKAEDKTIIVKLEGSGVGLDRLRKAEADIALLAIPSSGAVPGDDIVAMPVAYYTAVLAVRNSIPVSQLSFAQIGGIFGDAEQNNYRRWSDVGVTGPWASRSILAAAISRQGGLSFDLLRSEALRNNRIKPTVVQFDTPAELVNRVRGEEGGVAVLPLPPSEDSGLKVLLVSRTDQGVAYPPTSDNLNNGDYPLRLPLYVAFHKSDAKRLNALLRYLLGEDALPLWTQAGLIPAPVQVRNQFIFDLEVM